MGQSDQDNDDDQVVDGFLCTPRRVLAANLLRLFSLCPSTTNRCCGSGGWTKAEQSQQVGSEDSTRGAKEIIVDVIGFAGKTTGGDDGDETPRRTRTLTPPLITDLRSVQDSVA